MVESNGKKTYLFLAGFDGDPSRRPWRSVHQGAICRCFVFVSFLFRMVTVDLPFEKFEEVEFAWNMAFNFMTATMISGLRSLVLGKHQVDLEIEDFKHFLGFIKEKTSSFEEMIKIQEHFSGLKFTTHVDSEFTIISFGDDPNLEVTFFGGKLRLGTKCCSLQTSRVPGQSVVSCSSEACLQLKLKHTLLSSCIKLFYSILLHVLQILVPDTSSGMIDSKTVLHQSCMIKQLYYIRIAFA